MATLIKIIRDTSSQLYLSEQLYYCSFALQTARPENFGSHFVGINTDRKLRAGVASSNMTCIQSFLEISPFVSKYIIGALTWLYTHIKIS
jgi:hypothetical protein